MSERTPAVSIVVPAWNAWDDTAACLDSLEKSWRVGDQLIVVDNGSTDATPDGLRRRDVTVVTNPTNLGFARACNQGAERADHDIVVFLNSDTIVTPGWLDRLCAPLDDPCVAATGPSSNGTNPPQRVEVDDLGYDPEAVRFDELHRFTERWAVNAVGPALTVGKLYGFCMAVRRSAFEEVGGFSEDFGIGGGEDDDLCIRLRAAGHELRYASDAYVHHAGHRTFEANDVDWVALEIEAQHVFRAKHPDHAAPPLLSACLIVKDEAHTIERCLASVDGVVDEVVVYDTGSSDDTVAIARRLGARVVEGYWDDDFSRARNESLGHCTGSWILHIDADEELRCIPAALRQGLSGLAGEVDTLLIEIDNVTDNGVSKMTHLAQRLFRREQCWWTGTLHERVERRDGTAIRQQPADGVSIVHHGYAETAMADGGKADRNLRIALAALERAGATADRGLLWLNVAKSYAPARRLDEALDACGRGIEDNPDTIARHALHRFGVELLLAVGRTDEARRWIDRYEAGGAVPDMVRYLRGSADLLDNRPAPDLVALADLTELVDNDGVGVGIHELTLRVGSGLASVGRWDDALPRLLSVVDSGGVYGAWGMLAEACQQTGTPADVFLTRVAGVDPVVVLRSLLASDAEVTKELALTYACALGPINAVVAFAGHFTERLDVVDVVPWATLVRRSGTDACPLVRRAQDPERPTLERFTAAAVARVAFADEQAETLLEALVDLLDESDHEAASYILSELVPVG